MTRLCNDPGPRFNIKTVFPSYGISILKIRRSRDRLIFNMGIPILVRGHLYIEMASRLSSEVILAQYTEELICITGNFHLALLTHWGQVVHTCVSKPTIIGRDNGLSPGRRQAIIWTNTGIMLIVSVGTNSGEILIKILTVSLKKKRFKRVVCEVVTILTTLSVPCVHEWWVFWTRLPFVSGRMITLSSNVRRLYMCKAFLHRLSHFSRDMPLYFASWGFLIRHIADRCTDIKTPVVYHILLTQSHKSFSHDHDREIKIVLNICMYETRQRIEVLLY